jgi:hypothetical protein
VSRPGDEHRAAFRAFVREHHPDRGGDPDEFRAGLLRFAAGSPVRLEQLSGEQVSDEPAPAPVAEPAPLPFPVRVGVAVIRTWRWHRQRRLR